MGIEELRKERDLLKSKIDKFEWDFEWEWDSERGGYYENYNPDSYSDYFLMEEELEKIEIQIAMIEVLECHLSLPKTYGKKTII